MTVDRFGIGKELFEERWIRSPMVRFGIGKELFEERWIRSPMVRFSQGLPYYCLELITVY